MNFIFGVGSMVTSKTHPLLDEWRIRGDGKYVPPIMMVKEVFIESDKKQVCDEETGKTIAERVKYVTVYFDDNRSEFIESTIYESMLVTFENLKIERISDDGDVYRDSKDLIEEINSYKVPIYKYGKIVRFRTKKIEIYKKRSSKKIPSSNGIIEKEKIKTIIQYVVNYATPDFVICGFKINDVKTSYTYDGEIKRKVALNLLKVKWFNPIQNKFSEIYLPEEFFTDNMSFSKPQKQSTVNLEVAEIEKTNTEINDME